MVTDPPEGEDDGDGSGEGDPIEEVDFWEEVGETRPVDEADLDGAHGDASRSRSTSAEDEGDPLPDPDEGRWPGVDLGPDTDEAPPRGTGGRPSGDEAGEPADEPRREREDDAPLLGDDPDADAGETGEDFDVSSLLDDEEDEASYPPTPEARDPPGEADASRASAEPADGSEAGTEVVEDPEPEDPTPPELREPGPIEAGPEPREGLPSADGPCHICEDHATQACVSCERPACTSHVWVMFGLCEACATEEQVRRLRGERTHEDWSGFLGIKWVT